MEELILRTVAANADSLLRTARRYSLCADDAQDAYQRALEIFMAHAARLDPARAGAWLHVVVKREAQAIRRSRQKLVAADDIDLDRHEARSLPTSDEQLATFDLIGRSAEALQRLKPQELRALWLKAQGHSYNDIGAMTGWSYTKVNRCLTEGRRRFLERYATIESGAECERWLPVISAMVDGEATPEQLLDLRPHLRNCPGCRATLKTLQESTQPLAAVLPVPLVAVSTAAGDHLTHFLTRVSEIVVGSLHERAATSMMKVQAVIETTATGKAAAIAGAAAAVASGGYATIDPTVDRSDAQNSIEATRSVPAKSPSMQSGRRLPSSIATHTVPSEPTLRKPAPREEFEAVSTPVTRTEAPEFRRGTAEAAAYSKAASTGHSAEQQTLTAAPEFSSPPSSKTAPEFGP